MVSASSQQMTHETHCCGHRTPSIQRLQKADEGMASSINLPNHNPRVRSQSIRPSAMHACSIRLLQYMYLPYARSSACSKYSNRPASTVRGEMRSSVFSVPAALLAGVLLCLALPAPAVAAGSTGRTTTLSVLSFGAAGDGVTDDAKVRILSHMRALPVLVCSRIFLCV